MRNQLIIISVTFLLCFCSGEKDLEYNPSFPADHIDKENSESENYTDYGENPFIEASKQAVSTFGIDADGGSYSNMRRFSTYGQRPPIASVRIEEFLNYFNFDYPNPINHSVSINSEMCVCPWNTEHHLLRIGLKGEPLDKKPESNFVFLIDVSGSMSSVDKLELLKKGFLEYVNHITESDKVAIVTYAGSSNVLLESTYGDKKSEIKTAIEGLSSGGSTAGAEGIKTAYEIAEKNFIPGGNNRVIIGSDGDFNVGISSTDELIELVEKNRNSGIFLTVLGVGSGNLNDAMMEQIANNGNGTYEYIDNEKQINKVFNYDFGKFFTVARDCKIQIEFNPDAVYSYRLIGYENRVLDNKDFENDSVDSGEIGASQTITALYEIVTKQSAEEKLASIDFRYKKPLGDKSHEISHAVENQVTSFELSSSNTRFAASVAGLGLYLRESKYKGDLTLTDISKWAENSIEFDPRGFKQEFMNIVERYK